jgi:hypothetical protein
MDDYRREVEQARADRNGDPVLANRSQAHAAVILENLFQAANHSVDILSHELLGPVYDEPAVLAATRSFLQKEDTKLSILVEKDVDSARPFLRALAEFPGKTEVTRVPDALSATYSYNFCVADEDCYRFEPNRCEYEATIQFGNAGTAGRIKRRFQEIKALALDGPGQAGQLS